MAEYCKLTRTYCTEPPLYPRKCKDARSAMSRAKAPLSSTMANQNGSCSSPIPTGMQLQQTGRWRSKSGNKTTVSIGMYVQQSSVSWANRSGDCSFRGIPSEAPLQQHKHRLLCSWQLHSLNAGHFEFHCHQVCCLNAQLLTCCFFCSVFKRTLLSDAALCTT